jgi:4-amino-4-deoxy-L-arabinose transferase-like glycosyltransferase
MTIADPARRAASGVSTRAAGARPPGALATLLVLAAVTLCLTGARGLFEPDEGRYSAVAWNMVKSGDWFTPHLASDVPHFTKPPLTYWALAASMKLFGRSEWALRLPAALAGIFTVLVVLATARRLVPLDPLLAAVVQATSLLSFVGAHLVTTDPLLMLFETLAVFGFVAYRWDAPTPRWALPVMWLGFGLCFFTKGPPGLLPLLPILAFVAWTDGPRALARLVSPVGLVLFALAAFPWFLAQVIARPDLLHYLLGSEVSGRLAGVQGRNPGLAGLVRTYLPIAIVGPLPWSAVALARRRSPAAPAALAQADATAGRFLWLWLLLPLLVFSLAQSRQPLYLLPLSAPVSLLLARALAPRWRWTPRDRTLLAAWAVILVALAALGGLVPSKRDGARFASQLAALVPAPPRALIFVDRPGRYSAAVYLDCDVESVAFQRDLVGRAGPAYQSLARPLGYELSHPRPGAIWLVPADERLASWQRALAAAGWSYRRLGQVDELAVFSAAPPT